MTGLHLIFLPVLIQFFVLEAVELPAVFLGWSANSFFAEFRACFTDKPVFVLAKFFFGGMVGIAGDSNGSADPLFNKFQYLKLEVEAIFLDGDPVTYGNGRTGFNGRPVNPHFTLAHSVASQRTAFKNPYGP